jgi:hypothetical protein
MLLTVSRIHAWFTEDFGGNEAGILYQSVAAIALVPPLEFRLSNVSEKAASMELAVSKIDGMPCKGCAERILTVSKTRLREIIEAGGFHVRERTA